MHPKQPLPFSMTEVLTHGEMASLAVVGLIVSKHLVFVEHVQLEVMWMPLIRIEHSCKTPPHQSGVIATYYGIGADQL